MIEYSFQSDHFYTTTIGSTFNRDRYDRIEIFKCILLYDEYKIRLKESSIATSSLTYICAC